MHLNKGIFWTLLILSCITRVLFLEKYPNSVNQDELSNIYDAHCIAETGAERHAHAYPTRCEGFGKGDNRPALLAWLMALPQKLTGFSVWSARLTTALIGILALLFFFLWISKVFPEPLAMTGTLLFAWNPWLIWNSRIAHEGTILPAFFLVLFLFLLQKSLETNKLKWWILAAFCIGFSVNAYNANTIMAPVWMLILLYQLFKSGNKNASGYLAVLFVCVLGALPKILLMLNQPQVFAERALDVRFNPHATNPLYLIFDVLSYFNPRYLLDAFYNNLSIFRLTISEYLLMLIGLFALIFASKKSGIKNFGFWPILLLSVLLPGLVFAENPQALRTSSFPVMAIIFATVGWAYFSAILTGLKKQILAGTLLLLYLLHFGYYVKQLTENETLSYAGHKPQLVLLGEKLKPLNNQFDSIYCIEYSPVNHLYIAAFGGITPAEFQKIRTGKNSWYRINNDRVLKMGRYIFTDDASIQGIHDKDTVANNLYITDGYQLQGAVLFDSVVWKQQVFYFYRNKK